MRRRLGFAFALAFAFTACSEEQAESLPPTTGFYFPIGLATTRIAGDTKTALLVSSTNFDLRYSGPEGGTLASLVDPLAPATSWTWADTERTASYLGPVAVADSDTCPTLGSAKAVVASRYDDRTYLFDIANADGVNPDGALTVGAIRNAPDGFDDPFAVTVACSPAGNRAYVAYLDPPDSSQGTGPGAWIGELDLGTGAWIKHVELGDGPVRAMAYDSTNKRLWATTQSDGRRALLHMVDLSNTTAWNGTDPRTAVTTYDLDDDPKTEVANVIPVATLAGAELGSVAIGAGRLYIAARLYDVEAQASLGRRPSGDVGGELVVLKVVEGAPGSPPQLVVRTEDVDLGIGLAEVAVVKGAASDVVVISSRDQDRLFFYDDATLTHGELFGENSRGVPDVGDRPIALAVDPDATGAWVYVASFGDHVVRRFHLDPAAPYAAAPLQLVEGVTP